MKFVDAFFVDDFGMPINHCGKITMKPTFFGITVAILLLVAPAAHGESVMDVCRAYARAIEAVAEARDNLGQPPWDELVNLHPILQKNGTNMRAVIWAKLIDLDLAQHPEKDTPHALKMRTFETCPTTYSCFFLNKSCPK